MPVAEQRTRLRVGRGFTPVNCEEPAAAVGRCASFSAASFEFCFKALLEDVGRTKTAASGVAIASDPRVRVNQKEKGLRFELALDLQIRRPRARNFHIFLSSRIA